MCVCVFVGAGGWEGGLELIASTCSISEKSVGCSIMIHHPIFRSKEGVSLEANSRRDRQTGVDGSSSVDVASTRRLFCRLVSSISSTSFHEK